MAQKKKTQAQQAVKASRTRAKKQNVAKDTHTEPNHSAVPVRMISSICFLACFVFCLIMFFSPDGFLTGHITSFLYGLLGKTGFAISIPVLLYLFYIHAFSGDRPVKMRTICLWCFVVACGCISHLVLDPQLPQKGWQIVKELYFGGIYGKTGGVVCGGIATLLSWLCGRIISYIGLIVCAILSLLAAMQITLVGIVRAFAERPREDRQNASSPRQEPASIVVDHIMQKRIEKKQKKQLRSEQFVTVEQPPVDTVVPPVDTVEPSDVTRQTTDSEEKRFSDIIRQIGADIPESEKPAEDIKIPETVKPEEKIQVPDKQQMELPESMPELKYDPLELSKAAGEVKKVRVSAKQATESAAEVALEIAQKEQESTPAYAVPPIDLLKLPGKTYGDAAQEMRECAQRLNETLESFKIEAHIIDVTRGPSVTRYEVELDKGVRLSKLTNAAGDIALSLGASGVRIAAIPGKMSVVGIEVPNKTVTTVTLREVIDSAEFKKAKSFSSFAVGKDIGGNCIVGNISRLPHMLIAGTTGSGKSVCMNSIIISLLYKASPADVKLIMIDPKMVELGIYNGIPHLLIPVVTDPKKAAGSLQWAVTEMMRRYKAMSDVGVRDLESYNSIIEGQEVDGTKFAQVVVIIDELADLMLVAAKEVEESICRIAQMGRAAGIHLLIATQRPSSDVITGLMKANIPSRIAFAVASALESRIILDTQGAENLVGRGDMLYAPIGSGKPKRVQGCFVSDSEVEAVANYVKTNFSSEYDDGIIKDIEKKAAQTGGKTSAVTDIEANSDELAGDEMLPDAVEVFLDIKQASVSMLQRRLKLGYARAARIVDEMEELGIVGPSQGSKPREILITREQWEQMRSGKPAQMDFDDLSELPEENEDF